ncbi:membrane protein FxsA [Vibrio cholerae]
MFPILLLLFIIVPIIEIGLFIQVGGFLGLWPTIGLVLVTAFVGASLVRSQGVATLLSVQQRLAQGELPAQQIMEGVMLAVAGVLLLTPGFLTDALGMLVLLPAPRAMIAKTLMSKMVIRSVGGQSGFGHDPFSHYHQDPSHQDPFHRDGASPFESDSTQGETFEGEYERKDDENDKPKLK